MISLGLFRARRVRPLLLLAVAAGALALGGCQVDGPYSVAKHLRPLSNEMLALLDKKGMSKSSPLLVRVFKEEAELEIWKQNSTGQFALLKTYPICRWSGELGPKIREGDRQAPEGFYAITPGQMNPNSSFYLSFNLGYPNAFDRAHGRTGAHLMVHGDCSSRGCYSMTDEQIAEIFALGREAFFAGQRSFQVQAYPFRMTALNMAKHRNNPHMSFWKNLKQGYDHFEVTRREPKVDVCEKRYVFNAQAPGGSNTPLAFQPAGKCPAFEVPREIAAAVAERTKRDEAAFASYVGRGTPTVAVKTGRDGGMHRSFLAMYETREVRDEKGNVRVVVEKRPGGISWPDYNPAPIPEPQVAAATPDAVAAVTTGTPTDVPMPRPVPGRPRVSTVNAYAGPAGGSSAAAGQSGSFFNGLFSTSVERVERAASSMTRVLGFGSESKPTPAETKRVRPRPQQVARPPTPRPAPDNDTATASVIPASTPSDPGRQTAEAAPSRPSSAASLMPGAQPVVPANSFESRWQGAVR